MKINYLEIVAVEDGWRSHSYGNEKVLKRVATNKKAEAEKWLENWKEEISKRPTWWMTWKKDNETGYPVGWIEEKTLEIEEEL